MTDVRPPFWSGCLPGIRLPEPSTIPLVALGNCSNLHYRWRDKEDVNIPVPLEATPTQFGGRRWWFICPLIVRGVACTRRSGKLYLPPGAKYFGCRECHDLTYRSCQEAHQAERLFGRLGFGPEVARLFSKRTGPARC